MFDQNRTHKPVWLDNQNSDLDAFKRHIAQETTDTDYPRATEIASNIPIYDGAETNKALADHAQGRALMAEWNRAFLSGPGIIVIRNGQSDHALIDAVTEKFEAIIKAEEAENAGKGDHFATAGANSRIWNAHEKLCMAAPDLYVRYNANEITRRVSESWLGSGYQITFQVNVVRPGGKSQTAHRDYHMGFQDIETLKGYPASQHALSASLTLQGGITHCDMSIESGPTKLLPFSQSYLPGYIAVLLPEFREVFEDRYVQLPMSKGDMLFFNPATFHAAGENRTTDVQRVVNLMQVGSGFGRSIEIVDRSRITLAVYDDLTRLLKSSTITAREADNVVAATAEGYPFPANLDIDSPLSGMAPPSQQDVLRQALAEDWPMAKLEEEIAAQNGRKRSH
ncbi:phytanoyl-CoA dioxygenase family protein [Rhodobacteraceae bacterium]|nr:phytanoyl-CoA dioxygenase family protein [Paracoccaceae bacterium]